MCARSGLRSTDASSFAISRYLPDGGIQERERASVMKRRRAHIKRGAGGIGAALIVTGNDDALPGILHDDLCAAKDVSGRCQADVNLADPNGLAIGECLGLSRRVFTHPQCVDREGFRGGQNLSVPWSCVIRGRA